MAARTVTVAIPTRDRAESLCAVVRDLWAGSRRPEEILVVCQGAADEAARLLRDEVSEATPVIRFYASRRHGTNANRNDAVRLASGDFVAFSDDDMRLPETWLETMLEVWRRDWKCGDVLLTGPIQSPVGNAQKSAAPGRRVGDARRVWTTPFPADDVLYGGHFGAPMTVYGRVGPAPFDERFGPGAPFPGAGDEEFALRVLGEDVPIVFEPSLQATHRAHPDTWIRDQFQHCQGSGALFVARSSRGDAGATRVATRTVATRIAKGVRASFGLRVREAAGRFAGLAGLALGAWRWRVGGAQHSPRAQEPEHGDLTLVELT